jgi:gluconate:H+ symporter, GntP family
MTSGPVLIGLLVLAIVFIVWATARAKWHPFLVLLAAAYGVGLLGGLSAQESIDAIVAGFGGTAGYIGIVIAAGTVIGVVLERSGGALVMAEAVVRWVGRARAALAMSLTGAVVSIPVFCDSGFVILSPLNRSLAARSRTSMATFAVALAMGLYTTHVFVPPTPGPIAAAGALGADIGLVMIFGVLVTLPVLATTYAFARFAGDRIWIDPGPDPTAAAGAVADDSGSATDPVAEPDGAPLQGERPAAWMAFAPVLLPTLLIALRSVADLPARPFGEGMATAVLRFLGNPNTALLLGVALALWTVRRRPAEERGRWVGDGLTAAGGIILITAAGGALGRVLQTTPIGDYLGATLGDLRLGTLNILLPFLIAAALKTALGSSTVAIITTASIVAPLLPGFELAAGVGPVLATLAISAGAMLVSHANDSFFWVVSQFSGMTVSQAYRLHTVASAVAGVTGIVSVLLLSLVLL